MVEKYNSVVNMWRRVSCCQICLFYLCYFWYRRLMFCLQVAFMSRGLRYGDAVKLMSSLEDASNGSELSHFIYVLSDSFCYVKQNLIMCICEYLFLVGIKCNQLLTKAIKLKLKLFKNILELIKVHVSELHQDVFLFYQMELCSQLE